MEMTHYMELLATNQPWNLIIFMAIPVLFAETLAITEFFRLFYKDKDKNLRMLNKVSGIFLGLYFTGIFLYLFINVVIPLTMDLKWRGVFDVVAVGAYLSGVFPLANIALLEFGITGRHKNDREKLRSHVVYVSMFLVVAHVAMVFGMLSPALLSGGAGH
jgi:hypothetical protein